MAWIDALISGCSGVGGAVVGASATILMARRSDRGRHAQERRAAFVDFYAASNEFAHLWDSWSKIQPAKHWLAQVRFGIQTLGLEQTILNRLFQVSDHFWTASGRARSLAAPDELEILNDVESVISEWEIGRPMPDTWGPAIRRLRDVVEGRIP